MFLVLLTPSNHIIEIPITPYKFCNMFLENKQYSICYKRKPGVFRAQKYIKFRIWSNDTFMYSVHIKLDEPEYDELSALLPVSTLEDYCINLLEWWMI